MLLNFYNLSAGGNGKNLIAIPNSLNSKGNYVANFYQMVLRWSSCYIENLTQ